MSNKLTNVFVTIMVAFAAFFTQPVSAQNINNMVRLANVVPAALSQAKYLKHHDPSSMLKMTVVLKLRNTEQLHEYLDEVRDSNSSAYQKFLTPQQFTQMYGPTTNDVNAVIDYLESHGMHVADVSSNNLAIHATAQSGVVEQALGVKINDYVYQGRNVFGTEENPQFPSNVADTVQTVLGLNDLVQFHPMLVKATDIKPLTSSPPGYSPLQIATAYNWPSITNTANGAGAIIAIATADSHGFSTSDPDTFWSYYGLPTHSLSVINVDGTGTAIDGITETTIDTERAGAMAPGASLKIYVGVNNSFQTFYDVYNAIISANQAQIMTTSWGAPESVVGSYAQADDALFMEAAAEGIAVFAAAGDWGSYDGTSNPDTADYPSSDPYVVAAGGTTLTLNANNTIADETAWSCVYSNGICPGTGGAQSAIFPEPSWQVGPGVPQNGVRNTVDMSMDADPNTGYSVYVAGNWTGIPFGGTSFVAPELAGLFAIQFSLSGTRLAQANSAIYIDANSSTYSQDFHDITAGCNGYFCAGPGWDHPTGWGSPNATNLIAHIGSGSALSPPINLSAEYIRCVNKIDKYLISWQAGPVGHPSAYDLDYEYGQQGWVVLYYGPLTTHNLTLTPGYNVTVRVRATNGKIWSSYTSISFAGSPCNNNN
jgi:kumamolisin